MLPAGSAAPAPGEVREKVRYVLDIQSLVCGHSSLLGHARTLCPQVRPQKPKDQGSLTQAGRSGHLLWALTQGPGPGAQRERPSLTVPWACPDRLGLGGPARGS